MKTLQINLAAVTIFLFTSVAVNAQSKSTAVSQPKETKQKIELAKDIPTASKPVVVSSTPAQRPTRVSDYMGMEKKIMTWTIAGDIPSSIPKYKEGQTKEEYNAVLKTWGKSNLNLIKKEYHTKITSDKATSTK